MTHEKPNLAGKKSGNSRNQKRRERIPEPELFEQTIIDEKVNEQVTPVKEKELVTILFSWQIGYYKIIKF